MYLPQIILVILSLAVILLWFRKGSQQPHTKEDRSTLPAAILAAWVIASAVFGANFYALRFAGFFDISIERLLFSLLALTLVVGLFQGRVQFLKNITIEIVMGIFVIVSLFSMLRTGFLPAAPDFPSPWYVFISGYLFPFIVFVYAKHYIITDTDMLRVLHALFYFGLYLSIIAFFEYADLRQYVFPTYINDPELSTLHLERARGPFLNAAFNGVGILIGLISGLHLLQTKQGFGKFFYQTALLIFFPAVFFTLTRSVYLGLLITLFIFLGWYKTSFSKWKLISLPLALVLILAVANAPRLLSEDRRAGGVYQVTEVNIRLALLEKSFTLFSERPLTGVGLAQFIPASLRSYTGRTPFVAEEAGTQFQHNHLLGIATELGAPGLLLYLLLIVLILRRLRQLAGKLAPDGIMGNNLRIVILAIWCVYLNNNLFVEPSNNIFVNAVPFLFAGLADGLYTRSLQGDGLPASSLQPGLANPSSMRIIRAHV